jgi:uncharacterized protein YyaL (SSP411 family)
MFPATPSIVWLPWSPAAFGQARVEGKRILLWVTANWSQGCRAMAADTYADPQVVAEIAAGYVAVRVDADERPDLADRYDLGGLPTTAILDPDGVLVGGGTFVPADRLRRALARLSAAPAPPTVPDTASPTTAGAATDRASILAMIEGLHDLEHGGCGAAPKFPHVAPIRLALRMAADGGQDESRTLAWALRSLDAIGWGGLSDEDGGFFRYSDGADWSSPRPEKLLAVNAALLDLVVEAAVAGHGQRFLDRAQAAVEFIERHLRRADGAWRVAAGPGPARVLTDANAATVSAMLRAAHAFGDDRLAARAVRTLEDVLLANYRPGEGVGHCGGGVRGLLTDNLAMAAACLDAWEAAAQMPHRMMAEELVHYVLRTMWDGEGGGFFDRAPAAIQGDPAGVVSLKPFVLNCDAAVVLERLASQTGDTGLSTRARETLASVAPLAMGHGPLAAHYLLAARAISD